jgi:hypothetical protein
MNQVHAFRCDCKKTVYALSRVMFRVFCHCTICQRFNQSEYGDTLVCRAKDLTGPIPNSVSFDTYRSPPNIKRGTCNGCQKPAIEVFESPFLPNIIMVPLAIHRDEPNLPASTGHLFYDRRVHDVSDDKPKHYGYLRSQLTFGRYMLASR